MCTHAKTIDFRGGGGFLFSQHQASTKPLVGGLTHYNEKWNLINIYLVNLVTHPKKQKTKKECHSLCLFLNRADIKWFDNCSSIAGDWPWASKWIPKVKNRFATNHADSYLICNAFDSTSAIISFNISHLLYVTSTATQGQSDCTAQTRRRQNISSGVTGHLGNVISLWR